MATILACTISVSSVSASQDDDFSDRQTLDAAISLAGRNFVALPIVTASVPPEGASPGIEGWTTFRADDSGDRIFVYTGSGVFRCAMSGKNQQCLLKLASVVVHEAWHFANGRREDRAYAAQINFLTVNRALPEHIAGVRLSRRRVLAAIARDTREPAKVYLHFARP